MNCLLKSLLLIYNQALGQFACHGRKHLQTIFTIEIYINSLAASVCMIDFFCKTLLGVVSGMTGSPLLGYVHTVLDRFLLRF